MTGSGGPGQRAEHLGSRGSHHNTSQHLATLCLTTRTSPSLIELLKNHSLESGVLSYQQLEVVFHYA